MICTFHVGLSVVYPLSREVLSHRKHMRAYYNYTILVYQLRRAMKCDNYTLIECTFDGRIGARSVRRAQRTRCSLLLLLLLLVFVGEVYRTNRIAAGDLYGAIAHTHSALHHQRYRFIVSFY